MTLIATLLLTISLGIIVMMQIKQRRFAQGENAVLEFKVKQRTKELAQQKKMLIKHTSALEESDARARAVLENAAESIIIIDHHPIGPKSTGQFVVYVSIPVEMKIKD